LSEVLGVDTFTVSMVNAAHGKPFQPSAAQGFYYAKVSTERLDLVGQLTASGFSVVDVSVTFERKPSREPLGGTGHGIEVREVSEAEHDRVLDIAKHSFLYSRFHLDPLMADTLADEVKRSWIESYIQKRRGEKLWVAVSKGQPVGFLADLAGTADGQKIRVIDLISVAKEHQGCGAGKALVEFFVHHCASQCDRVQVGTQVANIPSMRLYERCGFMMVGSAYVLHGHFKTGNHLL
jgi:GNAT superfamily N-acetyltransferase